MKNFFKKLAFVLAIAMVVTAIGPAGKASAATAPTLKKSSKVLYIGGDKTGNIGDTYRFTFNNAAGYTATWKSSKKTVATVDAKSGNIQAVGVGSTDIKATLTNKAGKAVELVAKVTVKQNAEKVGFGSLAAVKEALAVGDTVKVNVYRQVGTTKVWAQSDKSVSTDVIKWTTSDAKVATVDKWGKVTAIAAGKATITATATQTEGSTAVVSKSFDVEVQAGLKTVTQKSANTFEAIFAGDLSAVVNATNVKVYTMIGATKVAVVVKSVTFDSTDKTKAIITSYTDFVKDSEYVVEYATTSASFKGADLSRDAVSEIKITTTEVVKGDAKDVVVKAYNANGVELPASVLAGRLTLSADSSTDYYFDASNSKITFYNAGKVATIKAVFHTYTYGTDFKEIVKETQGVIKSVDVAAVAIKTVDVYTAYKTTDPDFKAPNAALSLSDNSGNYKVAVKTTTTDGKELLSTTTATASKFTFTSSDETTLIVRGTTLLPVKEGGATIVVKYDNVPVGAFNVTIGPKRAASDLTATLSKTTLSKSNGSDSVVLTVKVKDQYQVERTGEDLVTVTYLSGTTATAAAPVATKGDSSYVNNNVFTWSGSDFTTEGSYQYKVKVGNVEKVVVFDVKDAGTSASYYVLSEAGKIVDTSLKLLLVLQ
jgi:hypothetical protein